MDKALTRREVILTVVLVVGVLAKPGLLLLPALQVKAVTALVLP